MITARFVCVAGLALLGVPVVIPAQQPAPARTVYSEVPASLSLEDARIIARRRNPVLLQTINNRRSADAAVRAAYGAFLPSVDASLSTQYQQGGRQIFQGTAFGATSDILQSNYRIGLVEQINSATFVGPKLERAQRRAVEADIIGTEAALRASVTDKYIVVLQAQANATLQDTLVASAETQLVLSRAREIVGSGTALDIRRSEIILGQAQVARIQARNTAEVAKLRLFEEMGVEPRDAQLSTRFEIAPLILSLEELKTIALAQNPGLEATRQRARVADLALARTRAEYTPTLTVATGWGGYTYQYKDSNFPVEQARAQLAASQAGCVTLETRFRDAGLPNSLSQCQTGYSLSDAEAVALRRQNEQFPFDFNRNPRSVSATLSLPLFDGFAREARFQEAAALRADARYTARARELALAADVTAAYLTLQAARETAELQERNAGKARDELSLAQDRYRLGSASFLDLTAARDAFAQAESDRIRAVYEYHRAFAALESAVGRSLR